MVSGRKTNFILILFFIGIIATFAYSYNASVTTAVRDTANNDRAVLQNYNNEIIEKIKNAESIDEWTDIIEQYDNIVIRIRDSENNSVAQNNSEVTSALDVMVRSAFEYNEKAYLLTSSIYLFRDYTTNRSALLLFVLIELMIALGIFALLIVLIYAMMLRPYRLFYLAVEKYERTGEIEKKKFKGYIGKVYERFSSMTENLERQQENQRRIIASISHDIKTPLTSIMGYAEQLRKDNISPERKKRYLDKVYGKSLEIQGLVDEFDEYLSYNMPQAIHTERMSVKQLCRMIEDEYADELENLGVDFRVNNYSQNISMMIDSAKMRRVFGNIISNCLKHFKDSEKKIRVDVNSSRSSVIISISDNGEGVPDDELDVIFEPLYTSDKGRKVAGLGLAICHDIVESHLGRIYAKKSDMGGLEVCIELDVRC